MPGRTRVHNRGGRFTRRILIRFDRATETDLKEGLEWYEVAHIFAHDLHDRYGITVPQAVGIIAALSPQRKWGENMRYADRLCRDRYAPVLGANLSKALRILDGQEPLDVLGGLKVRSFYDNILYPLTSRSVTIDRHAVDLAHGCELGDAGRKFLDYAGGYNVMADAYRAAGRLRGVRPLQVQAVAWTAWRNDKREAKAA